MVSLKLKHIYNALKQFQTFLGRTFPQKLRVPNICKGSPSNFASNIKQI